MWFWNLLLAVLLTALFYMGPVLVYRFVIRKKPLEKKSAIITVIVFGFVLYLIMWLIAHSITDEGANAAACTFWSFINYFILAKGNKSEEPIEVKEELTIATDNKSAVPKQICFCRKCGQKLIVNSNFCNNCGSKIDWN